MTPLVLMLVLTRAIGAQAITCDSPEVLTSVPRFVECARAGTERYHDRQAAIRDGYRRIGRDFPAMGEHWIRIALVFDSKFDPSRPEVLNYVEIGGKPRLLGVGYAMPLLTGEAAPAGPAGPRAWHDHFRSVDEETVLPDHHTHGSANNGARLAMMHAWIWSPNPEGVFAPDNWAIPFVRHNLIPPAEFPIGAAKALSLLSGGRDYVEASIRAVAGRGDHQEFARAALDDAVRQVTAIVPRDPQERIDAAMLARLASIWTGLWTAIDGAAPADVRQKLMSLAVR
jgi:hypothetical protein